MDLAEKLDLKANTVSRYETGLLQIPKVVELALETVARSLEESTPKNGQKRQSFATAAAHLIGSIESGVGDLSVNKKHMEGFGRD